MWPLSVDEVLSMVGGVGGTGPCLMFLSGPGRAPVVDHLSHG